MLSMLSTSRTFSLRCFVDIEMEAVLDLKSDECYQDMFMTAILTSAFDARPWVKCVPPSVVSRALG
jgi:hypothetical protein